MFYFSVELLVFAAAMLAAASYRYVYRVTTIRLIDQERVIAWTDLDRMFCGMATLAGVLLAYLSVRFGITYGALCWVTPVALIVGGLIGRLLAVSHIRGFQTAVGVANGTRTSQIAYAKERAPSQSEADISYVAAVGRAASIARNNAVENAATKWLRN